MAHFLAWLMLLGSISVFSSKTSETKASAGENVTVTEKEFSNVTKLANDSEVLISTFNETEKKGIVSKGFCSAITYMDVVGNWRKICYMVPEEEYEVHDLTSHDLDKYAKKIQCVPRNSTENETLSLKVKIINGTFLVDKLNSLKNESTNINYCAVVMFYAPWCNFCANTAPHYNALARVFPGTDIFAMDAIAYNNLNFRFGIVAVPNILIFHNSKLVARFNSTKRTLEVMSSFVANVTGLTPNKTEIIPEDYNGPLSSTVSDERDYLLWMSWTVLISVSSIYFTKSSLAHNLWQGIGNHLGHTEHVHVD